MRVCRGSIQLTSSLKAYLPVLILQKTSTLALRLSVQAAVLLRGQTLRCFVAAVSQEVIGNQMMRSAHSDVASESVTQ